MKRLLAILAVLLLALVVLFTMRRLAPVPVDPSPVEVVSEHTNAPPPVAEDVRAAQAEVRRIHGLVANFLLVMKDPNRPPLGDNRDVVRALTGHNRRGLVLVPTNDTSLRGGQLVDRWGTPYWFHARSADAIVVVSAGPDRKLFTVDDVKCPDD